jgi:flagellar basal-body rod protein FlgG
MIRALYTAASGMNAQQSNIDNIAQNLANVNTTGFKQSRVEFEDLVYQEVSAPGSSSSASTTSPTGMNVGLGTRVVATSRDFTDGDMTSTGGPLDLAISGAGFFTVTTPAGTPAYTRAGNFHLDQTGTIVTADGYPMEPAIVVPTNATSVTISSDGTVSAAIAGQTAAQTLGTIQLATFANAGGLSPMGSNLFTPTAASGDAITGVAGQNGLGTITQGFLESSNVSVVEEMVNMIIGQRAYEANSRVVKAADDMLSQTNQLVR